MKKILVALLILALLVIASAYVFIPAKIKIRSVAETAVNGNAAYRFLLDENNWKKWWPGPEVFRYNKTAFTIIKKRVNGFEINFAYRHDSLASLLQLTPLNKDSTLYAWSCEVESAGNPLIRIQQYLRARQIKKMLDALNTSLKNFTGQVENVYGFKPVKTTVTDSSLISTRSLFNHYPDHTEIEVMIQRLRDYIRANNATEKNFPMLNVHRLEENNYQAMVAIATNKPLPATADFSPKFVLKGGNLLEAEFKGGPFAIRKGFEAFEHYKFDYSLISPAIPYQLMITDRAKEPDTSRWLTKFCYPIF